MTRQNISSLVIVVLIGLLLQVGLIFLDRTDTPYETAVRFAKAYYQLSPSMTKWLCNDSSNESATSSTTGVDGYLYHATKEAAERGFGKNFARYALSHIETQTKYLDKTTAVVHLTARRRIAINPLYDWVARLFRIGETHEVDENIRVKLEEGRWRVCAPTLSMMKTG